MKEAPSSPSPAQIPLASLGWSGYYAQPSGRGIGSRGPGESQLELNRRSVRNQITDIERQLKVVEKNRATVRENVWSPAPLRLV